MLSCLCLTALVELDAIVCAKSGNRGIVINTHGSSRNSPKMFPVVFERHASVAHHKIDSDSC